MKILKCENGHYFDNDAYATCPLCGADPAVKKGAEGEKRSIVFGRPRAAAEEGKVVSRRGSNAEEDSVTVALPRGNFPAQAEAETARKQEAPAPQPAPEPAAVPPQQDLKEALQQASATSSGKTLSYFSAKVQAEAASPQPAAPAPVFAPAPGSVPVSSPEDPVVGWLVGIEGPHLCETLPIFTGLNSIGRSDSNRMVLAKDPAVSREKHAFVTFEPKSRQFYLRPGDSSGLTYLNGQYIYETKPLAAGDTIELGRGKYYFLPLCGENFSWDPYLN